MMCHASPETVADKGRERLRAVKPDGVVCRALAWPKVPSPGGHDPDRRARRPSSRRSVPRRVPPRPRRHGDGLRGHGHPARAHGRRQGDAPDAGRGPRVRQPLRPRGPLRRPAEPPERGRRSTTRARTTNSSTSSWSTSHGQTAARPAARARPAVARGRARRGRADARRARRRARRRHRSTATSSPRTSWSRSAGTVKVADFGLARAAAASTVSQATQGVLIGTVAYLSPEQVERGVADAALRCVCGRHRAVRAAHRAYRRSPARPRCRSHTGTSTRTCRPRRGSCAGLPPVMDALVRAATNRDPELRPADAGRLLDLWRGAPGPRWVAATSQTTARRR